MVVPFTTPLLAAARVRRVRRDRVELVAPNPSGGKGVYVLRWDGVRAMCAPTVHDTLLFQRLEEMPGTGPREVRDAALAVAVEGHAGRPAAAAARKVMAADRNQRIQTNVLLLQALVDQVDPATRVWAASHDPELDQRAAAVLQRLATGLRRPPAQLGAALSAMAGAFAPVGVGPHDSTARIPRLLGCMEDIGTALSDWPSEDAGHDPAGIGSALAAAFRTAARNGRAVVAAIRTVLADPVALLTRRVTDAPGVPALAERADWLLDGWERCCLIWKAADDAPSRRQALLEMAQCIPVLPREAFEWAAPAIAVQAPDETCRVTGRDGRPQSGSAVFAMIERNEKLRAMSL